jgi:hypothetical protein
MTRRATACQISSMRRQFRLDAERRLKMHVRVQIKQQLPVFKVECTLMYVMKTRTSNGWTEIESSHPASVSAGRSRSHNLATRAAPLLSSLCATQQCSCTWWNVDGAHRSDGGWRWASEGRNRNKSKKFSIARERGDELRAAMWKLETHTTHQKDVRFSCKVCFDHSMRAQQPGDLSLRSCGHPPVSSCFLVHLCTFRPECSGFVLAPCIHVWMRKCSPGDHESASPIGEGASGSSACCAAVLTRSSSAHRGHGSDDQQAPTCTYLNKDAANQDAPGTGI